MEKKNLVMVALCVAIGIMAIAYAAFSTTLTVNGTVEATGDFAVEFVQTGSCTTTTQVGQDEPTGTIAKDNGTTATLNVLLYTPGDTVTCTIDVKNTGNLAARLAQSITGGLEISNGLSADSTPISVTVTSGATTLAASAEDTITVVVKYNWEEETQPTNGTSASFTITADYEQNI